MSNELLIALMWIAVVVLLLSLGSHIGFVLGMIAVVAGLIGWGGTSFFYMFPIRIFALLENYVMVAVPLFVFMGFLLERSGLGEDLFGGVEYILGGFRGGMAITVIVVTTLVAACTGIVATGVIMAGVLALPSMLRRGYNKGLALGSVAAGGTLGILIPPSVNLVIYAALSATSVGKLFLGAFPSGFLLSGIYITYTALVANLRPKMAPKRGEVPEIKLEGMPEAVLDIDKAIAEAKYPRLRMFRGILPVVFIITLVMGSIIGGIATPTEAAAFGAASALAVTAMYRRLSLNTLKQAMMSSVQTVGTIAGVLVGAMCFSAIFMGLGGKDIVFDLLMGTNFPPSVLIWVIVVVIVFMGCFLDALAIMLILLPVVLPIQSAMGWHPIWFALIFNVTMQTAWLTPPLGFALVFLRGLQMPGVTFGDIVRGCAPFIGLQLIGVAILIQFPIIITYFPDLLIK
ncbi:TRAP transporter large permease subunit [Chloroflexota bacterium]